MSDKAGRLTQAIFYGLEVHVSPDQNTHDTPSRKSIHFGKVCSINNPSILKKFRFGPPLPPLESSGKTPALCRYL